MEKNLLYRLFCILTFTCIVFGLSVGSQPALAAVAPASGNYHNPILSWLDQHAIPYKTENPQGSLADLQFLRKVVGDAPIVGLGEATHGTYESSLMKHRMFEFLVEKMGFTVFTMEIDWETGKAVNDYIHGGQANVPLLMEELSPWNTQEVLDMLNWMRTYNADASHKHKIEFVGFDCQGLTGPQLNDVIQYVAPLDAATTTQIINLYTSIVQSYNGNGGNPTDQQKAQNLISAQKVYDLLKDHRRVYEKQTSHAAFALALQNSRLIVQVLKLQTSLHIRNQGVQLDPQYVYDRDAFMAENIAWTHENIGGKEVAWAHDGHIATVPYDPQHKNMGSFLQQRFGQRYLAVGFSVYEGAFEGAPDINHQLPTDYRDCTIPPPPVESYNKMLGMVDKERFVVDLRHAPDEGLVGQWLEGPHGFFEQGFICNDQIDSQAYTPLSLRGAFDVLIHIQHTTGSHILIPPAQQAQVRASSIIKFVPVMPAA